ncbi:hypothetical protein [Pseudoduganella violacea]|uniref:Uncharacterized protein n=1 Tax=Pseudoduganella violacea TaxID=1715466 RepID=A0A7W5BAV8_9BURK|nr:hypothetical protein [Pseudoduganella violacea]MBB3119380.1 hypothetical protein [Pseudoduganella violacea]
MKRHPHLPDGSARRHEWRAEYRPECREALRPELHGLRRAAYRLRLRLGRRGASAETYAAPPPEHADHHADYLPARLLPVMALCALVLAALVAFDVAAMEPMNDKALSAVRGGDGVSFDLSGFRMDGDARLTYTAQPGRSIYSEYLSASRSDSAQPFADPYRIDIVNGAPGLADVIRLDMPRNADGAQKWQFAYDWGVSADGIDSYGGAVLFKDLVLYGGGWQFSTPRTRDGVAFGAAVRMEIGQLALRANGRNEVQGQMAMDGIRLGAVDSAGNFTGQPWVIADVAAQPGSIDAVAQNGGPRLHIGIAWPDAQYGSGQAPQGGIQIDKISFTNPGGGVTDFGSSRIGSVQIQYLDIKFRP